MLETPSGVGVNEYFSLRRRGRALRVASCACRCRCCTRHAAPPIARKGVRAVSRADQASGEGGELRKGVRLSRTSSSLRTRPRDVQRERELFYACGYDVATKQYATPNLEAVRAAFQGGFVGVNCRDNTGTSPLAHAAWVGHEELIALLIERGADLDAENLDGATPLHYTVYNNQPRAAALLLTCGAEPATALEDTAAVAKPEVLAVLRAAQAGKVHPLLVAARRKAQDWNLTRTPR